MPAPIDAATIRGAPKVLLHDHLDGGLRPQTVLELADAIDWALPAADPASLQQWFTRGADRATSCSTSPRSNTPLR